MLHKAYKGFLEQDGPSSKAKICIYSVLENISSTLDPRDLCILDAELAAAFGTVPFIESKPAIGAHIAVTTSSNNTRVVEMEGLPALLHASTRQTPPFEVQGVWQPYDARPVSDQFQPRHHLHPCHSQQFHMQAPQQVQQNLPVYHRPYQFHPSQQLQAPSQASLSEIQQPSQDPIVPDAETQEWQQWANDYSKEQELRQVQQRHRQDAQGSGSYALGDTHLASDSNPPKKRSKLVHTIARKQVFCYAWFCEGSRNCSHRCGSHIDTYHHAMPAEVARTMSKISNLKSLEKAMRDWKQNLHQ